MLLFIAPGLQHARQMVYYSWVIKVPRTARIKSITNIYHVMLRGTNRQIIFENDGDRYHFMTVLKTCKEASGFILHTFCLMPNHIHLLIEPKEEPLHMIFKRIETRYAVWYNRKYQRAGHLFQDRFRSENVETEQYYMTVLRYILQNPMKAGMEIRPGTYRWSSYLAYEIGNGSITDTQYAIDHFGSREALVKFLQQTNDDTVMDEVDHDWRLRDDQAKEIMSRITDCNTTEEFQKIDLVQKKEYVRKMFMEKLSMSQISRLTGMAKSTVFSIVKKMELEQPETRKIPTFHESETNVFNLLTDEIW